MDKIEKNRSKMERLDYSKAELETDILEQLCIWKKQGLAVEETDLSEHFKIVKKTLTAILKQMVVKGYIKPYQKNGEIQLTEYGTSMGNQCMERHSSISQFLQYVGVSQETAEIDACRAEHFFSDETVKAFYNFTNSDIKSFERRIKNTDLTDKYEPGTYSFMMQIYSMGQTRPREFREENFWYTGNIILEIGEKEGWFEFQYDREERFTKTLWYKYAEKEEKGWFKAERGKCGERIPANAFEFIIKANEAIIEGSLLIAYTGEDEVPDMWNSCQLEIELW